MKMFSKVLVAEDYDNINLALKKVLEELCVKEIVNVSYCDEALLKIKQAHQSEAPFDLLITDLSFDPDHVPKKLTTGQELIAAAKHIQPSLKILVYSVENKPHPIQYLFKDLGIDGYIVKGRNNIPELKKAMTALYLDEQYRSPEISQVLSDKSLDEIDDFDLKLMQMLSQGISQAEISSELQKQNISPNSVSSIEKRINRLKSILGASNNVQLIALAKDLGLV